MAWDLNYSIMKIKFSIVIYSKNKRKYLKRGLIIEARFRKMRIDIEVLIIVEVYPSVISTRMQEACPYEFIFVSLTFVSFKGLYVDYLICSLFLYRYLDNVQVFTFSSFVYMWIT